MRLDFAKMFYVARAVPHSAQRVVNLYAEAGEGKDPVVLYGTPGMPSFASVGDGPTRGAYLHNGVLYVVSGAEVYTVTSAGVATLLPGVPVDGSGPVSMSGNATQVVICTNTGLGYIATTTVVPITDGDFPGATVTGFLDGYTLYIRPQTDVFFVSDLNAAQSIRGSDFATAEARPDNLVTAVVANQIAWLFGETTTEAWVNVGGAGFPLGRVQGSVMEKGCAARMGAVRADNTVFFLGNDRTMYRIEGVTPRRVSTHAIEEAIRTGDLSDCRAWTYSQGGHVFVGFTFPALGRCFVHDASTGLWHERESFGLPRWRGEWIVEAFGKVLAGDYATGTVWELDLDTYTEAGGTIERRMVAPPLWNEYSRGTVHMLALDIEAGVGLTTGSDPQAMMKVSKDGGKTWGNELWRSFGAIGEYGTRAKWNRLGQFGSKGLVLDVTISDPVKVSVMGAYIEAEGNAL